MAARARSSDARLENKTGHVASPYLFPSRFAGFQNALIDTTDPPTTSTAQNVGPRTPIAPATARHRRLFVARRTRQRTGFVYFRLKRHVARRNGDVTRTFHWPEKKQAEKGKERRDTEKSSVIRTGSFVSASAPPPSPPTGCVSPAPKTDGIPAAAAHSGRCSGGAIGQSRACFVRRHGRRGGCYFGG